MSNQIYQDYLGKVGDLIRREEHLTFLVGAGISMDSPTNMPSAKEIVKNILNLCSLEDEIDNLLTLKQLRYELIVEKLQAFFDPDLKFMEYLELVRSPNIIHYFLAHSILRGFFVLTTNFDYLIEYALLEILDEKWHIDIIPVITREDFTKYNQPSRLIKNGKFPIYKVHGSKRNVIKDVNTKDSLITTISALGKDRERGQTFAIEPYKKQAILNLMQDRTLIVMGYSGSDDFDIGPTLKEMVNLKKLIWIEHSLDDIPVIKKVNFVRDVNITEDKSQVEQLLVEIRNNTKASVFIIRVNTNSFLRNFLWKILLPNDQLLDPLLKTQKTEIPNFGNWLKKLYDNINLLDKYRFTADLYYSLKQIEKTGEISKKGLELATSEWNSTYKSKFYNFLGLVAQIKGEYQKALTYYESGLEIDEKLKDLSGQVSSMSNIGTIQISLGEYQKAESKFLESLDISENLKDISSVITALNNLGRVNEIRYKFGISIEYYQKALKLAENLGDLGLKAAILNNIGRIKTESKAYDEAFSFYVEALKISEELGDLYGQLILQNNIGRIFHEKKDFNRALERYKKTIEIAKILGDKSKLAGSLNNIGSLNLIRGNLADALRNYKEALRIEQELGDPYMQMIYLNNIGMIHASEGELASAVKYYQDAFEIAQEIGDKSKKALLLSKIATIYVEKENFNEAIMNFNDSLKLYEEIDDNMNSAAILNNLGRLYEKLKDFDKSIEIYTIALEKDRLLDDSFNIASDLVALGRLYNYQQQFQKSLSFYEEAYKIFLSIGQIENGEKVRKIIDEINQKIKTV